MTILSEQLADAMTDAGYAERVTVFPGQFVVIRTVDGEYIGEGFVEDVDDERQLVRVRDTASGTDVQLDIDATRYVLWMKPTVGGASQAMHVDLVKKAPPK